MVPALVLRCSIAPEPLTLASTPEATCPLQPPRKLRSGGGTNPRSIQMDFPPSTPHQHPLLRTVNRTNPKNSSSLTPSLTSEWGVSSHARLVLFRKTGLIYKPTARCSNPQRSPFNMPSFCSQTIHQPAQVINSRANRCPTTMYCAAARRQITSCGLISTTTPRSFTSTTVQADGSPRPSVRPLSLHNNCSSDRLFSSVVTSYPTAASSPSMPKRPANNTADCCLGAVAFPRLCMLPVCLPLGRVACGSLSICPHLLPSSSSVTEALLPAVRMTSDYVHTGR